MISDRSWAALEPICRGGLRGERGDIEYPSPSGDGRFVTTVTRVRDEADAIWGALAVTQDVSNERRAQRELREQTERSEQRAKFDELTGLFTRGYFRDRLDHAIARAVRDRRVLAVMFVDIDHFRPPPGGLRRRRRLPVRAAAALRGAGALGAPPARGGRARPVLIPDCPRAKWRGHP